MKANGEQPNRTMVGPDGSAAHHFGAVAACVEKPMKRLAPGTMKRRARAALRLFVFAGVAAAGRAVAGEDSTHRWFQWGMNWWEHPCSRDNLALFSLYGQYDTPENRRNYQITKRDASRCAALFPMPAGKS